MNGFIQLHRKILNNKIFNDANLLQLFLYCLLQASYKPYQKKIKNQILTIDRGSFLTTRVKLSKELHCNEMTIYKRLQRLKELECITIETYNKYSIITVLNYNKYQSKRIRKMEGLNNKKTAETPINTDVLEGKNIQVEQQKIKKIEGLNNKNGILLSEKSNIYNAINKNLEQDLNNKKFEKIKNLNNKITYQTTENKELTKENFKDLNNKKFEKIKNLNNKQKIKCIKNNVVTDPNNNKEYIYYYRNAVVTVWCKIINEIPESSHYSFIGRVLKRERDGLTYLQRALLFLYCLKQVDNKARENNFKGIVINRYKETSYSELKKNLDNPVPKLRLVYVNNPLPYMDDGVKEIIY